MTATTHPLPAAPGIAATLFATLRPPFLLLTPASMAPLLVLAAHGAGRVDLPALLFTLVGALAAHGSVNVLNEWHDWRSGLDLRTRRTPFSGGSGALPANPAAAPAALRLGIALLLLAALCGVALLRHGGAALWPLIPIGATGALLVVAYTPWVTRHPWLCLLAPGLGFGPLMGLGALVAAGGRIDAGAWVLVTMNGLLTSALLFINQFPDIEADRSVGRRNLPLLWGPHRASRLYVLMLVAALAVLALGVVLGWLPATAALGLLATPVALRAGLGALQAGQQPVETLPTFMLGTMRAQVILSLATPVLVAIGLGMARTWPVA